MKTRSLYIVVLGVIALGAIIAAVYVAKEDHPNTTVGLIGGGLIAIAAFVVGALATLAHEIRDFPPDDEPWTPNQPPPWSHDDTESNLLPGKE